MSWMVVLVTALGPFEFQVTPLTDAEDYDMCNFKALLVAADIQRRHNQELLCIQVDYDVTDADWPSD